MDSIEEKKIKKYEAEKKIKKIMEDFEKESGMKVSGISIYKTAKGRDIMLII